MALKNQKVNKMIYFHQNFMKQHYHQNRAFYQKTYFQEGQLNEDESKHNSLRKCSNIADTARTSTS